LSSIFASRPIFKADRRALAAARDSPPLDLETLSAAAREAGQVVVVEDHAIDGGL
jgi:hypothetical protein